MPSPLREHFSVNYSNIRIVKHCRKSLLISKEKNWKKKSSTSYFDVTMRSYYGAEIWNSSLVIPCHIFKQWKTRKKLTLYGQDGIVILWCANGQKRTKQGRTFYRSFQNHQVSDQYREQSKTSQFFRCYI